MIATVAPPSVCPRCGARLRPEQAIPGDGVPGYAPVLTWRHDRPDGRGRCVVKSGPPLGHVGAGPPREFGAKLTTE